VKLPIQQRIRKPAQSLLQPCSEALGKADKYEDGLAAGLVAINIRPTIAIHGSARAPTIRISNANLTASSSVTTFEQSSMGNARR
jgi:hypothetical protein